MSYHYFNVYEVPTRKNACAILSTGLQFQFLTLFQGFIISSACFLDTYLQNGKQISAAISYKPGWYKHCTLYILIFFDEICHNVRLNIWDVVAETVSNNLNDTQLKIIGVV